MPAFGQPAHLPLDVFEIIVGDLAIANDIATLKNCSLVSSDLLSICRKHIFSRVELEANVTSSGISQIQKFKRLLDHNSSIADYIRTLDYTSVCDSKAGPPVLQHFRRVTTFTFAFRGPWYYSFSVGETQEWKKIPRPLLRSLAVFIQCNKLVNLFLFQITDIPVSLFAWFPFLRTLTLNGVRISDTPLQGKLFKAKRTPKTTAKLVSLFIKNSDIGPLIKLPADDTLGPQPMLNLTGLEIFRFGVDEDPSAMEVVRLVMKKTDSLRLLALSGSQPYIDFLGMFTSPNPGCLQLLEKIELYPMLESQEQDPYLNLVPELEQIAGKNAIEEIMLRISIETDRRCTTDAFRWDQLDRTLSQEGCFPFLRSVQIKVIVHHCYRELAGFKSRLEEIGTSCFTWLRASQDIHLEFEVTVEDV